MELRAIEDIASSQDLTPPIPPLAFSLHDSALNRHCSACFSPLPPNPCAPLRCVPNENQDALFYCSSHCSSLDSQLHFSSAEPQLLSLFAHSHLSMWDDSAELRLSLRLHHIFHKLGLLLPNFRQRSNLGGKKNSCGFERIAGLLTNRERLLFQESEAETIVGRIREGAKAIATARMMCAGEEVNLHANHDYAVAEMILCLVFTNAVEVLDKNGLSIGVAVYGTSFSWINHSCSPNACFRFSLCSKQEFRAHLRIAPAPMDSSNGNEEEDHMILFCDDLELSFSGSSETRQAELWFKYRFSCTCARCSGVPSSYVDRALQMVSAANCKDSVSEQGLCQEEEIEKLTEAIDDAVTQYLSFSDARLCCEKLESLFCHGSFDSEHPHPKTARLIPFHHLSLNAYIVLTSAYKVHSCDLLSLNSSSRDHKLHAFNMLKTSSAYSLLLAGASHHLFTFESSLVASVANFWMNAGESLLNLSSSSLWDLFHECALTNTIYPNFIDPWPQEMEAQQWNCIASLTSKVWSKLVSASSFLKSVPSPVDFSWLDSTETFTESCPANSSVKKCCSGSEAEEDDDFRISLILLGIHCLRYGAHLSSICYGFESFCDIYDDRTVNLLKNCGYRNSI